MGGREVLRFSRLVVCLTFFFWWQEFEGKHVVTVVVAFSF